MTTAPRLRLAVDSSAGDWVVRGVGSFGSGVGGLVPHGFEAYGRILHPARGPGNTSVSWATVADWSGGAVHPRVQFEAMAKPRKRTAGQPAPFDAPPPIGSLPASLLATLCQPLGSHTTCPDRCWFCLWEGYGWVQGPPAMGRLLVPGRPGPRPTSRHMGRLHGLHLHARTHAPAPAGPRVRIPNRDYLLFEGPLEGASDMGDRSSGFFIPQSPNLFWPDDHAWCVATEIDLDSTYVGGSTRLIADLLADDRLEALRVEVTDEVWAISDDVNL
jgi:hypothetical protein